MTTLNILKCYLTKISSIGGRHYTTKVQSKKMKFVRDQIDEVMIGTDMEKINLGEKIYCIVHDIRKFPSCIICGRPVTNNRAFYGVDKGYRKYCSIDCINKDPEIRLKIMQSVFTNYLKKHEYPKFENKVDELKFLVKTFPKHYQEMLNLEYFRELNQYVRERTPLLNDEFYSNATRVFWIFHNITEFPRCHNPKCNKEIKTNVRSVMLGYNQNYSENKDEHRIYCGRSCASGDEIVYRKTQEAKKDRLEEITNKMMDTCFKHNGVRTFLTKKDIKEKSNRHLRMKVYERMTKNDFVEPLFDMDFFLNNYINTKTQKCKFKFECKLCGEIFESYISGYTKEDDNGNKFVRYAKCPKCADEKHWGYSYEEEDLAEKVRKILPENMYLVHKDNENRRIIKPYQIDVVIREKETDKIVLGIEYDGIFWHSKEFLEYYGYEYKNKQIKKTIKAENKGITLIHVWEDEWLRDESRILKYISNILENKITFEEKDTLVLDRSMFPKTIFPKGYKLISETGPTERVRRIPKHKKDQHVYDCGTLIYQKIR